jgi:hypothetical protein
VSTAAPASTTPTGTTLPQYNLAAKGIGVVGPTPTADENMQAIEQVISAVLAVGDPSDACDALVTARYVRETYGGESQCRRRSRSDTVTQISFNPIGYRNGRATTIITVHGGSLAGQAAKVALVFEHGRWLLDSVSAG